MNDKITQVISFAVLVESLVTYFREFCVCENFSFSMLFSIVLGVLIAVAYKLDLPEHLNLKSSIPYVGNILTGILISRGSNYIYDVLKSVNNIN